LRLFRIFSFFCFMLTIGICQQPALYAQDYYPGKTVYIRPSLNAAYFLPFAQEYDYGGNVQFGVDVSDIINRVNFGIGAGYRFYAGEDDSIDNFFIIELSGGYTFPLFDLIGINPNLRFSLLSSIGTGQNTIVPAIRPGLNFDLHLFNRNYLVFGTSVEIPLSEELSPGIFFHLGIRQSIPHMIKVPPVELRVSITPELFSPDEDGENDLMDINLAVKNIKSVKKWNVSIFDNRGTIVRYWTGTGLPPERIEWNGVFFNDETISSASDYSISVQTIDKLNNSSIEKKNFSSDILVEEIDTGYKIRIPSIIFPPGSADVNLLTAEDLEKNYLIIEKIAEKLLKFPSYNIRIEGHGNIENWSSDELAASEQVETLIPLTEARAMVIKDALIASGLRANRISVRGLGGSFPVVPFDDELNRWKNRRVEFILLR